jgi:hypothetical protein
MIENMNWCKNMEYDINKSSRELIDELLNLYHLCEQQCKVIEKIIEKLNEKE